MASSGRSQIAKLALEAMSSSFEGFGIDRTHAQQSAERIRSAVAGAPVLAGQVEIPVTVSIGVTAVTSNASKKEVLAVADELCIRRRALDAIARPFCELRFVSVGGIKSGLTAIRHQPLTKLPQAGQNWAYDRSATCFTQASAEKRRANAKS